MVIVTSLIGAMLLTLFVVQAVVEVVYEWMDEVLTHFLMVEQEVIELLVLDRFREESGRC